MFCTELLLCQDRGKSLYVEPLKCRCWNCEHCQPIRRKQLIAQGLAGQPNSFITLTITTKIGRDKHHRAQLLKDAWTKVRRAATRKYGYKSIPFLAVFEATEQGEPHLHIIARCPWIKQEWLSDQMEQHVSSPVCWIERIYDSRKTAFYVVKYVGKEPHRFQGTKRYWMSQDYLQPIEEQEEEFKAKKGEWFVSNKTLHQIEEAAKNSGASIQKCGDGILIIYGPTGPPKEPPGRQV